MSTYSLTLSHSHTHSLTNTHIHTHTHTLSLSTTLTLLARENYARMLTPEELAEETARLAEFKMPLPNDTEPLPLPENPVPVVRHMGAPKGFYKTPEQAEHEWAAFVARFPVDPLAFRAVETSWSSQ